MAKVVWLRDNAHSLAQSVLPWYVTGQIDEDERAAVEDHLASCAACREDLEAEREIAALLSKPRATSLEPKRWLRPGDLPQKRRSRWHQTVQAMRNAPARSGWLLAGSVAAASMIAIAVMPRPERAEYHTLGAQADDAPGNLIVIFRPDTSEREFRSTLAASQARLVDGPTASGAYVLRVPQTARAAILSRLQAQENVVLAQPLDAAPSR